MTLCKRTRRLGHMVKRVSDSSPSRVLACFPPPLALSCVCVSCPVQRSAHISNLLGLRMSSLKNTAHLVPPLFDGAADDFQKSGRTVSSTLSPRDNTVAVYAPPNVRNHPQNLYHGRMLTLCRCAGGSSHSPLARHLVPEGAAGLPCEHAASSSVGAQSGMFLLVIPSRNNATPFSLSQTPPSSLPPSRTC